MGRRAETEALDVWPRWPLAYALCAALSALGSVLSVSLPVPGAALALAGALLFIVDAGFLIPLARRPLGRRASQNVISWDTRDRPGRTCSWPTTTLAAVASLSGAGCAGSSARSRSSGRSWRCSPAAPPRLAGSEGIALSVVQFVPTVVLIVAVALLLDIALSPTRAGENDNASGVALALRLAERFSTKGPSTSGSTCSSAAPRRPWPRARADSSRATAATCTRTARCSSISTRSAWAPCATHARRARFSLGKRRLRLTELGDASSFINRSPSDGYAALLRGYPVVTLSGSETAGVDAEAMERAEAFCAAVIERLDAELGPGACY